MAGRCFSKDTHRAFFIALVHHLNLSRIPAALAAPDLDAFEERAAIIHDAHTSALDDDGAPLGWDEVDLFGVCPVAPWVRLDRKGAAFGGAVQAVTSDAMVYVGGLRRYRAIIHNDGGAVPIWELAQDNPSSGGHAA